MIHVQIWKGIIFNLINISIYALYIMYLIFYCRYNLKLSKFKIVDSTLKSLIGTPTDVSTYFSLNFTRRTEYMDMQEITDHKSVPKDALKIPLSSTKSYEISSSPKTQTSTNQSVVASSSNTQTRGIGESKFFSIDEEDDDEYLQNIPDVTSAIYEKEKLREKYMKLLIKNEEKKVKKKLQPFVHQLSWAKKEQLSLIHQKNSIENQIEELNRNIRDFNANIGMATEKLTQIENEAKIILN